MTTEVPVAETELIEVLKWAEEHVESGTTDHPVGSYEEGVHDAILWMLGEISIRPDQP